MGLSQTILFSFFNLIGIFKHYFFPFRLQLNIWDVGGQKSLRSFWRNYFESTDGLIWVVDCGDKMRLQDSYAELKKLLGEEVIYEC